MSSSERAHGRLHNRVCVITGTAGGVGRASAVLFAEEGAHVVGVDRDCAGHRRTRALLNTAGHSAHLIDGDVTDTAILDQAVDHCAQRFGHVDVLFNNAATVVEDAIDDVDVVAWRRTMEVNVTAPLLYIGAFLPLLSASGHSSIINHGSIDGVFTNPHLMSYSVSKAALGGLTRAAAATLAARGIRANAIASGNAVGSEGEDVDGTDFARRLMTSDRVSWPAMFERLAQNTPGRRVGTVEDLARVALFLASDDSSFVNGVSLLVDGGRGSVTPGTGWMPSD